MSLIVGLTGGIGSGKSAAAEIFATLGTAVVDTDAIAHELTGADGVAMPEIAAAFGVAVVSPEGVLKREAMRRLVFGDPVSRRRLENILHPLIRRVAWTRCTTASSPYVVLVVPLLIESDAYRQMVRRILAVDCDEALQIKRVMARSGLAADEVRRIMSAQVSRAERLARADDIIDNNGDLTALTPQVEALHRCYLALAASGSADLP